MNLLEGAACGLLYFGKWVSKPKVLRYYNTISNGQELQYENVVKLKCTARASC